MPSSYQMFVKEHIHQFNHLPAKQRMKAVAELYHKQKSGASAMPAKKGRGRPKKGGAMTAGSFLGDIVPFGHMLGLGLEDGGAMTAAGLHKKRGRPSKKGGLLTAAGLEDGGAMTAAGLHKKRGRPSKKGGAMTAGSFLGDIVPFGHMLGLGLEDGKGGKLKRKQKGGAMTAGAFHGTSPTMTGGGWFDDFKKGFMLPFEAIGHVAPVIAHLV